MGRKRRTANVFMTVSEWINEFGGKREGETRGAERPLPFSCCCMSFQPFEDAMCTNNGHLYDMLNIIPFIKKHGIDPVTGKKTTMKDLFKANFTINQDGDYLCPIMKKSFTDYSHIVINRATGNVFSYEAIEKLCFEPKQLIDPLDDTPFTKDDIITIQDPKDRSNRKLDTFYFIKNRLDINQNNNNDGTSNINVNQTAQRIFDELKEKGISSSSTSTTTTQPSTSTSSTTKTSSTESKELKDYKQEKETKLQNQRKQSGQAPSFTSTGFSLGQVVEDHIADQPGKITKKKGYARLKTNLGDLNIQLHCDIAPKACENFLQHCEKGYYNDVIFHRLIKNFMIQGGDPTGSGRGGESIWGKPFKDEKSKLTHSERGILSMANSGPNTNGSQFFITLRPCTHLDGKHTIFGKVVGGLDVIKLMEMIKTDEGDRPIGVIKITGTQVFENPFHQIDQEELDIKKKQQEKINQQQLKFTDDDYEKGQWYSNPNPNPIKTTKTGVGKYIQETSAAPKKLASSSSSSSTTTTTTAASASSSSTQLKNQIIQDRLQQQQQQQKKLKSFGDFSNF
ncbi:cyclophilin-type peptidylprolyl cis-trans isomerase [Cavenderia fasciculata]|uniref:Cyclophilin-type peptidylprolyl cis-trans isomerase n=1 Tax=Cavenderia fasciculata TaxID=261658 RepID=F4Q7H4_CACFS|nr:cyclophilin-type peptidylprolyl cis-trans isomerase [Cavenderia fasciculata]EGG16356.1 cyclophilin-type peptidylprolyl cis-trans isomerase [Cavenderia fasciculata]|eukprot:XP_004354740.1 cyclophilin-type peptidylprolyl cis-trans isomerase [Cavenderia fasciculata]